MGLNLKALIGKLNEPARSALEGAAGLCLSRTNYDVEVEHYLTKLLESTSGDFAAIIKHFEIDKSRLTADLGRSLDKLKSGNARTPAISPTVLKMLTTAWTIGSIDFNAGQVRTGFTILALISDEELARLVNDVTREFQKINADALRKDLAGHCCSLQRNNYGARCCCRWRRAKAWRRQDAEPRPIHRRPHRQRPQRKNRPGAWP